MKRIAGLYQQIFDFDNIVLAAYKACKSKSGKCEVKEFRSDFYTHIARLRERLINKELSFGNYNQFIIYEPKKRLICAASLEQRIIHHAIMNVCHYYFDRNLIFDSFASRPNKGVHKAVLRTQELAKSYRHFVKLDFRKYFDSINHNILKSKLSRLFKDAELLDLFNRIIDSYGVDGHGLPIGNLTSQYFANFYLSELDHRMKEILKCKAYIRYMDDVIIMADSSAEIKRLSNYYCNYASENLSLTVKPPLVGKICSGIPFLGYKVYKTRIMLGGKAKRRYKKNIHLLTKLYSQNRISEWEYSSRLVSGISFTRFADSVKFRKNVVECQRAPIA